MNEKIEFGKWKGSLLRTVVESDPWYARWLVASVFFQQKYPDQYATLRRWLLKQLNGEIEREQRHLADLRVGADLV